MENFVSMCVYLHKHSRFWTFDIQMVSELVLFLLFSTCFSVDRMKFQQKYIISRNNQRCERAIVPANKMIHLIVESVLSIKHTHTHATFGSTSTWSIQFTFHQYDRFLSDCSCLYWNLKPTRSVLVFSN